MSEHEQMKIPDEAVEAAPTPAKDRHMTVIPDEAVEAAHECAIEGRAHIPSFWKCPGCTKLWRVTDDNVAWAWWTECWGPWKWIARIALRMAK